MRTKMSACPYRYWLYRLRVLIAFDNVARRARGARPACSIECAEGWDAASRLGFFGVNMVRCVKKYAAVALTACAGMLSWGSAQAAVCDAKFMHDGGFVQFTGSGNLKLGADLNFSEVTKSSANTCRARVKGTASFSYAGLPPSASKLDYLMTVKGGQASFVKYDSAGERPGDPGSFDLRMLGLFGYEQPITAPGQKFPGTTFRLKFGKDAPVGGSPATTIRIGEKTVGQRASIATALGQQSCWPVSYDRDSDPTQATFNGLTLPIPGTKSRVTDWYCPNANLVMKQEINQQGSVSKVEITQIR